MIYKKLSIVLKNVDNMFLKDFIVRKMNLNNYNDLFDLKEHIQNVRSSLELVI